jgi:hypothetical protein
MLVWVRIKRVHLVVLFWWVEHLGAVEVCYFGGEGCSSFVLVLFVHVFGEVFEGEVAEDVVALEAYDERGKVFVVFSPAFLEVLDCFGVFAVVSVD